MASTAAATPMAAMARSRRSRNSIRCVTKGCSVPASSSSGVLGSDMGANAKATACAVAVLYSLWILVVSAAFFVVKVDNLSFLFLSIFDAARWPVSVFNGFWRFLFTVVIPLALMTTFPAEALLGRIRPIAEQTRPVWHPVVEVLQLDGVVDMLGTDRLHGNVDQAVTAGCPRRKSLRPVRSCPRTSMSARVSWP